MTTPIMLNTDTADSVLVKTTRIAGLTHDPRHAARLRQTARIYSYTRHIRRLAEDATPTAAPVAEIERIVRGDRALGSRPARLPTA